MLVITYNVKMLNIENQTTNRNKCIGLFFICLFLIISTSLLGCSQNQPQQTEVTQVIRITSPDGAPLLSLSEFANNDTLNQEATTGSSFENGKYENGVYTVNSQITHELNSKLQIQTVTDADALVASILKDTPEMAIVPVNLAKKLYQNNTPYQIAGVTTWGLNKILSNKVQPTTKNSLNYLKGTKLYAFAKTNTPGLTLNSLLDKQNIEYQEYKDNQNLNESKVNLVYLNTPQDVIAAATKSMQNEESFSVMLPEPAATMFRLKTNNRFSQVSDLQKIYLNEFASKYPQSVLVVRSNFADIPSNQDVITKITSKISISGAKIDQEYSDILSNLTNNFHSSALPDNPEIIKQAFGSGDGENDNTNIIKFTNSVESKDEINKYLEIIKLGSLPDDAFLK